MTCGVFCVVEHYCILRFRDGEEKRGKEGTRAIPDKWHTFSRAFFFSTSSYLPTYSTSSSLHNLMSTDNASMESNLHMNTLTIAAQDPVRVVIDYLLAHGGFMSLFGVPAVLATISFVYRILYLQHNRQPHNYGRTNFIYWPTQIFISLACLTLIVLVISQCSGDAPSMGLIPAALLMLVAWVSSRIIQSAAAT